MPVSLQRVFDRKSVCCQHIVVSSEYLEHGRHMEGEEPNLTTLPALPCITIISQLQAHVCSRPVYNVYEIIISQVRPGNEEKEDWPDPDPCADPQSVPFLLGPSTVQLRWIALESDVLQRTDASQRMLTEPNILCKVVQRTKTETTIFCYSSIGEV